VALAIGSAKAFPVIPHMCPLDSAAKHVINRTVNTGTKPFIVRNEREACWG
jgi:hypothetical protein